KRNFLRNERVPTNEKPGVSRAGIHFLWSVIFQNEVPAPIPCHPFVSQKLLCEMCHCWFVNFQCNTESPGYHFYEELQNPLPCYLQRSHVILLLPGFCCRNYFFRAV